MIQVFSFLFSDFFVPVCRLFWQARTLFETKKKKMKRWKRIGIEKWKIEEKRRFFCINDYFFLIKGKLSAFWNFYFYPVLIFVNQKVFILKSQGRGLRRSSSPPVFAPVCTTESTTNYARLRRSESLDKSSAVFRSHREHCSCGLQWAVPSNQEHSKKIDQ